MPATANFFLTDEDVEHYRREGYLVVRGLFRADEMERLAQDVDRVARERAELIDPLNMRVRFQKHFETGEVLFEVFDPISDLSPVAREIAADRRLLDVLHDLYGEPAELFKDKLIYKPAGASGATLHQDWIAWPGFPESFLTVVVAIDSFDAENGATEVFPRMHTQGYLSPKDGQHHYVELKDLPAEPVPLLLEPGDAAMFTCFTPHRSGPNRGKETRRGYFISYNARSDGGQQHARHYAEFHEWLRAKAAPDRRPRMFFK